MLHPEIHNTDRLLLLISPLSTLEWHGDQFLITIQKFRHQSTFLESKAICIIQRLNQHGFDSTFTDYARLRTQYCLP